jgi:signal transduction histidine kinase
LARILYRVADTKEVAHVADMAAENPDEPIAVVAGARTVLIVPMLKEHELVGAIAIFRQEVRPFTDKQVELLKNFAAQAVIAIENTRLLSELRESLEQQTATSEVLRVISGSPTNVQPVFDSIAESAVKLCGGQFSFVVRFDGKVMDFASYFGLSEEGLNAFRSMLPMPASEDTTTGRAILRRAVVEISDIETDPAYSAQAQLLAHAATYRSVVAVPLLHEGDPIGAIAVARANAGAFPERQIALLQAFADQAVIAIRNVRLFDEVQARTVELSESLQQQTATADVLKVISRSAFELHTVLDELLKSAARLCDAEQGTITQRKGDTFFRTVSYGFPAGFLDFVKDVPVEPGRETGTGRALAEGKIIHIPDVLTDPDYTWTEAQRLGGFHTLLGVPMLRDGDSVGVFTLTRTAVRPFTDKQIELVSTFADQAAIAIENVRLFEAEQQRTQELAKSLEDLRTAQDRLVQTQKLASLGQLTAGIAHEIKNPLNFVNNFSGVSVELIDELQEAVKHGSFDDKTQAEVAELTGTLRDNLDKIVQHGKRADSIVKNMLLHSREGSGERRSVDVNDLVEESLNLAYHGARAEKQGFNVTLERSFDPSAGEVDAYPQEITRVLLNLIANGFYAATTRQGQEGGNGFEPTISAATKSLGDHVEIRIRDNGMGIPPEVREKMFNPFFTTKPAGEGTGLGLSISHDIIVKQHSGSIEVDTEPGTFTEFRIVLPRTAS